MSASAREALVVAIVARLRADANLRSLVAGSDGEAKVFDQVDADTAFPYVYVGPLSLTRDPDEGHCSPVRAARVRIFSVSQAFGRMQAAEIGQAVEDCLTDAMLSVDPPYVATRRLVFVQSGDVIEPDDPKAVFADFETTLAWPAKGD